MDPMTTPTTPNADALSSLVEGHRNTWYARGCAVGRVIIELDPGEYRTRLVGYINLPVEELTHAPIIAAVNETLGVSLRPDTLGRHRRRSCSCPDEAYS
jgi:hypothetical protein